MKLVTGTKTNGYSTPVIPNLAEVRHSLALTDLPIMENRQRIPKQKTARLKIIHGRPYYYEIENVWDWKAQRLFLCLPPPAMPEF